MRTVASSGACGCAWASSSCFGSASGALALAASVSGPFACGARFSGAWFCGGRPCGPLGPVLGASALAFSVSAAASSRERPLSSAPASSSAVTSSASVECMSFRRRRASACVAVRVASRRSAVSWIFLARASASFSRRSPSCLACSRSWSASFLAPETISVASVRAEETMRSACSSASLRCLETSSSAFFWASFTSDSTRERRSLASSSAIRRISAMRSLICSCSGLTWAFSRAIARSRLYCSSSSSIR